MKVEQEMETQWSDPNQWNDLKPKEDMLINFEELRIVSDLHYGRNEKERKRAKKVFASLDGDGDGWIRKEDVMRSEMVADFGKSFLKRAFKGLDRDGDGYLSFDDSKALLYLAEQSSSRRCKACGRSLLFGHGFSCEQCLQEHADDFSLCYGCFRSRGIEHFGHGYLHFLHDFTILEKRLELSVRSSPHPLPSPPDQTMKQCIVCGDYHKSNAAGFMCNVHMCTMPDSNDEYVCEWCFCYFCYRCGNPFHDNPKAAIPDKWLQKLQCLPCSKMQTSQDLYQIVIQRYQELLSDAVIVEQCKTCKTKQKNGKLFWYINGSNILKPKKGQTQHRPQLPQLPQTHQRIQINQAALVHNSLSWAHHRSPIINAYAEQQQQGRPLHQAAFNNQQTWAHFQPLQHHPHMRQPQQLECQQHVQQPQLQQHLQQRQLQQLSQQLQCQQQSQQLRFQHSNAQQSNKTVESMKATAGIVSAIALGGMGMPGVGIALKVLSGTLSGGQASHGHGHGQEYSQGQGFVNSFAEGILDGLGQNLGQGLNFGDPSSLSIFGDISSAFTSS